MINQRLSMIKNKRCLPLLIIALLGFNLICLSSLAAPESTESTATKVSPQVKWVNFVATAPGHQVVISGKGFSKSASENSVTFGSIKARIVSASETSITCIVPHMHFPTWHVPITVTTNGMPSKEKVTINIDSRVIPNEGHPQL